MILLCYNIPTNFDFGARRLIVLITMVVISKNLTNHFTHGLNVFTKCFNNKVANIWHPRLVCFTRCYIHKVPCFVTCFCVFVPAYQLDTYEKN